MRISANFEDISSVSVWMAPAIPDSPGLVFLLPVHKHTVAGLVALLNEIDESYELDLHTHAHLLEGAAPSFASPNFERYRRREVWRFGSYVMFAANLEGILSRAYSETRSHVELATGVSCDDQAALSARDAEMRPIRHYRNKMFAHTAYSDPLVKPRGESPADDANMIATSVVLLTNAVGISSRGCVIGGLSVRAGGSKAGPGFEPMTLDDLSSRCATHLESWRQMYAALMKSLDSVDGAVAARRLGAEYIRRAPAPRRP